MRIIGVDLHARQQSISMLDTKTGEVVEKTLLHEGAQVREFYAALPQPVLVGLEATGSMYWFLRLLEELGIDYRVGHPAEIRHAETRKQKHDRRDAALLRRLLEENRFPSIWLPTGQQRDLRALLLHRQQVVRLRVMAQNGLQALALSQGLRRGSSLWSAAGQQALESLPLAEYAARRRRELQEIVRELQRRIEELDQRVSEQAQQRAVARRLLSHPGVGPVTALATEVYLGEASRFANGKALASYVGMIPSEHWQCQTATAGCAEQARQSAAAHAVGGSGAASGAPGSETEAVLSTQVGTERSGEGGGGHSAQAGDSAVDHDARPDRLPRVLPTGQEDAIPPRQCLCGNA